MTSAGYLAVLVLYALRPALNIAIVRFVKRGTTVTEAAVALALSRQGLTPRLALSLLRRLSDGRRADDR